MNKFLSILAIASVAALAVQLPSQASPKKSYVGPRVILNGLSSVGVAGRFSVAENVSIRPHIGFSSLGTTFGADATYDFSIPDSKITPYAGIGFETGGFGSGITGGIGADYDLSESIVLNTELSLINGVGIGVGLGFQF
jgi:hypothetical protein